MQKCGKDDETALKVIILYGYTLYIIFFLYIYGLVSGIGSISDSEFQLFADILGFSRFREYEDLLLVCFIKEIAVNRHSVYQIGEYQCMGNYNFSACHYLCYFSWNYELIEKL